MDSPEAKKQSKSRSRMNMFNSSDDLHSLHRASSNGSGSPGDLFHRTDKSQDERVFGEHVKTDVDYSFHAQQYYVRIQEKATCSRVIGCGHSLGCTKYAHISVHLVEVYSSSMKVVLRTCSSLALSSEEVPTLNTSQELVTYRYPKMLSNSIDICTINLRADGLSLDGDKAHAYQGALIHLLPLSTTWKSDCPCQSCQSAIHPSIGHSYITGCYCLELPSPPKQAPPGYYLLHTLVQHLQTILVQNHTIPLLISPHVPLPSAMSGYALYSRANVKTSTPEYFPAAQTSQSSSFYTSLHVVLAEPLLPSAIALLIRVHNYAVVLASRKQSTYYLSPVVDNVIMPDTGVTLQIASESLYKSTLELPWSSLERINKCLPSIYNAVRRHCTNTGSCRLVPMNTNLAGNASQNNLQKDILLHPSSSDQEMSSLSTQSSMVYKQDEKAAVQTNTVLLGLFQTTEEEHNDEDEHTDGIVGRHEMHDIAMLPSLPTLISPLPDLTLPATYPSNPTATLGGPWRGAGAVYTVQDNQASILTWYAGAGVFLPYAESRQADTVRSIQALLQGGTSRASILACINYILSSEETSNLETDSGLDFQKDTFHYLRIISPTYEFDNIAVCLCSHVWTAKLNVQLEKYDFADLMPSGVHNDLNPPMYPTQPPDNIPLLALDGLTTASMYPGWYALFSSLELALEEQFFNATGFPLVHDQIPPLATLLGSLGPDVVDRLTEYVASRKKTSPTTNPSYNEVTHKQELLRLKRSTSHGDTEIPLSRIQQALQEVDRYILSREQVEKALKSQYSKGHVLDSSATVSVCTSCKGYCIVPSLLAEYKPSDVLTPTEKPQYGFRQLPSLGLGVTATQQQNVSFRDILFDTLHKQRSNASCVLSNTIYTAKLTKLSDFQRKQSEIKVLQGAMPVTSLASVPSLWQVGSPTMVPFLYKKNQLLSFSCGSTAEYIRDAQRQKVQPIVQHTEQVLPKVGALDALESDPSFNNDSRQQPVTLHDFMKITPRHRLAPVHQTVLVDEEQRELARETQFLSFFNALLTFQRYQGETSNQNGGNSPRSTIGGTTNTPYNIQNGFVLDQISNDASEGYVSSYTDSYNEDSEDEREAHHHASIHNLLPLSHHQHHNQISPSSAPSSPSEILSSVSSTYDVDDQMDEAVSHLRPDQQVRQLSHKTREKNKATILLNKDRNSPFTTSLSHNQTVPQGGLRVRASSFAAQMNHHSSQALHHDTSSEASPYQSPSSSATAFQSPQLQSTATDNNNHLDIDGIDDNNMVSHLPMNKPSLGHSQWRKKAEQNTPAEQPSQANEQEVYKKNHFYGIYSACNEHTLTDNILRLLTNLVLKRASPLDTLRSLTVHPDSPATLHGVIYLLGADQRTRDRACVISLIKELLYTQPPMLGAIVFVAVSQLGQNLAQVWFEKCTVYTSSLVNIPFVAVDTPISLNSKHMSHPSQQSASHASQNRLAMSGSSPSHTPQLTNTSSPSFSHQKHGSPIVYQQWDKVDNVQSVPPFTLASSSFEQSSKVDRNNNTLLPPPSSPQSSNTGVVDEGHVYTHRNKTLTADAPKIQLYNKVQSFQRPLVRLGTEHPSTHTASVPFGNKICVHGYEDTQLLELLPVHQDIDSQRRVSAGVLLHAIKSPSLLPFNPLQMVQKKNKMYYAQRRVQIRMLRIHPETSNVAIGQLLMSFLTSKNTTIMSTFLRQASERTPMKLHTVDMTVVRVLPEIETIPNIGIVESSGDKVLQKLLHQEEKPVSLVKHLPLKSFYTSLSQEVSPYLLLQQAIVSTVTAYTKPPMCVIQEAGHSQSHSLLMRGNIATLNADANTNSLKPYHHILQQQQPMLATMPISEPEQLVAQHGLQNYMTPKKTDDIPQSNTDTEQNLVIEEEGVPIQTRRTVISLSPATWTQYYGHVEDQDLLCDVQHVKPNGISNYFSVEKLYNANISSITNTIKQPVMKRPATRKYPSIHEVSKKLEMYDPPKNVLEELVFVLSSTCINVLLKGMFNFKAVVDAVSKQKSDESNNLSSSIAVEYMDVPVDSSTSHVNIKASLLPPEFRVLDPRGGIVEDVKQQQLEPESGVVFPLLTTLTEVGATNLKPSTFEGPHLLEDTAASDPHGLPIKSLLDTIQNLHYDGVVALEDSRAVVSSSDILKESTKAVPPKTHAVYMYRHLIGKYNYKTSIKMMHKFYTKVQTLKSRFKHQQETLPSANNINTIESVPRPPTWDYILRNHTFNVGYNKRALPICDLNNLNVTPVVTEKTQTVLLTCFICDTRIQGRIITCFRCQQSFHHECQEEWRMQGYIGCPSICK